MRITTVAELTKLAESGLAYAGWYEDAQRVIEAVCIVRGWDSVRFACALSALSPRVAVKRNVSLMAALTRGEPLQGLKATWNKASLIWSQPKGIDLADDMLNIAATLPPGSAYKTACFAANLTGNYEPVTLDSWMTKAMGAPLEKMSSRPWYQAGTETIRGIAAELDQTPAGIQSAIWHAYAFQNGRKTMGNFAELLLEQNWGV